MKERLIVILLLFLSNSGFTQTVEAINELHHRLAIATDDTSKINQQAYLCLLYRLGNTDSSLFYGEQALAAARKINYVQGEILALSFMGITLVQMGNLPKALETSFKSIELAKENGLGNYSGALNAIGEVYIVLKDFPKALKYLQEQKSMCEADGNIESLAYAKKDLAIVFEEMNQLDSAMFYDEQAMKDFKKIDREEPQVYEIWGNIKMKTGNKAEALAFYKKSLQVSLKNNERRSSSSAYIKLASYFKEILQPDSAIYYAQKGLEQSILISQKKTIQEAASLLSLLYEPTDIKTSLQYLKISGVYKDSLFGANSLQAIQTLVNQSEEHQKQIEDAKINYRNQLKQYGLLAVLAIVLIIAFILYRNNSEKQKANKVLQTTLSDLKSAQQQLIQSEKMASLGELTAGIAHEIQNPLNFVNNFADVNRELLSELKEEVNKGDLEEVKAITDDVIENSEKILHHGKRADAIVRGMLQHSRTSSGQKEPTDINSLCDEYLRLSYHGLRAKDKSFNATLKTDFDNSIGVLNIIPQEIGRVIMNLLTNAFYAVNEKKQSHSTGYDPIVSISTKSFRDRVEIKIADNGNGISQNIIDKIFQPFFTTKPTGQGTGLGLSLAYDIVRAHGGELRVETLSAEPPVQMPNEKVITGTTFIISLPVI
ncbi:ATP-binding protein [Pollutibacter soli]|uniref:tetratricopeptide repeat-containing sensor histidine kinase n=1 Tax=Pollutibacter soli TaxID=3034157 RepID=UPI0030140F93